MQRRRLLTAALSATAALGAGTPVRAAEKIVFGTNWRAQAAHGGFYQALADGTYAKAGLDVEIRPGGPQVNNRPLLPTGRIDFLMTGNLLHSFDNVKNGVPTVAVAAMFQKDPQALFAHPGQGYERFDDLKRAPIAWIAKDAQFSFWAWLKSAHGFRDEQLRPYAYNLGPFLANKKSIQQGYAVEEPISIARAGGFEPLTFLLADHGYSTYSTLIEATAETVRRRPEVVQRFVDASIAGWAAYLHGDRRAGDALILRDNPDMTADTLDKSLALMKRLGIVDSGDAQTLGIGAMKPERVKDFYEKMVRAGLYKPGDVDLARVVTTQFVNRGAGVQPARPPGAPTGTR
jgi:NitT/TauT family transport system substrate-binding protein